MTKRPYYSPPYREAATGELPQVLCPTSAVNYSEFMSWFRARYMPCFPVEVLDTSEDSREDWVFDVATEVESIDLTDYLSVQVEDDADDLSGLRRATVTLASGSYPPADFTAVSDAGLAAQIEDWFEQVEGETRLAEVMGLEGWTAAWLLDAHEDGDTTRYVAIAEDESSSIHESETEAEEAALMRVEESKHGCFPWVWGWCWYPADNVRSEDLQACGFSVATFRGHRLWGVNGYGYSFEDAHFLPLAWRLAERWNLVIERDDGSCVIPITQPLEEALT